jgi:hypothetical protein
MGLMLRKALQLFSPISLTDLHSPKQYKDRFKKWGIKKNVQPKEMEAMIRIQRIRASDSKNPKKTAFRVRKQPVNQGKIDRYLKEHPIQWLGTNTDIVEGKASHAGTIPTPSRYTA